MRIARLALIEKGVDHWLVPVDVFAEGGPSGPYLALNPFGKIPAFEHGGFRLYETAAIARWSLSGSGGSGPSPLPSPRKRREGGVSVAGGILLPVTRGEGPGRGMRGDST